MISTTPTSSPQHVYSRLAKTEKQVHRAHRNNKTQHRKNNNNNKNNTKHKKPKRHRGGKWSMKYKKSIDCNKPKGFSQKQHCKYGRK